MRIMTVVTIAIFITSSAIAADLSNVIASAPPGIIYVPAGTTISMIRISSQHRLVFAPGIYTVSGTITIENLSGFIWEGSGAPDGGGAGTIFSWIGDSTDPMFNLVNVSESSFRNISIFSNPELPLATAFMSPNVAPSAGFLSTHNRFEHITMNGTRPGGLGYGFRIGSGATRNFNNNDIMSFDHVLVQNYTTAAWSFENSQSKGNTLRDVTFLTGQYGITTALGAGTNGGSFGAYGVYGGYNSVADIYLGTPDDSILVSGGNLEGSKRLLLTAGRSGGSWPVTIEGVRWAGNGLATDYYALIYTQRGPLNLIGNSIGDGINAPLALRMDPSGPAVATAIGNQIWSTLANPLVDTSGRTSWSSISNMVTSPSSHVSTPLPNRL
jgi:hypothetical protein